MSDELENGDEMEDTVVHPEPAPEPQPEPIPEPQPEPVPAPEPEPAPEPQPEPQPEPVPAPEPVPVPAPEPVPVPVVNSMDEFSNDVLIKMAEHLRRRTGISFDEALEKILTDPIVGAEYKHLKSLGKFRV